MSEKLIPIVIRTLVKQYETTEANLVTALKKLAHWGQACLCGHFNPDLIKIMVVYRDRRTPTEFYPRAAHICLICGGDVNFD